MYSGLSAPPRLLHFSSIIGGGRESFSCSYSEHDLGSNKPSISQKPPRNLQAAYPVPPLCTPFCHKRGQRWQGAGSWHTAPILQTGSSFQESRPILSTLAGANVRTGCWARCVGGRIQQQSSGSRLLRTDQNKKQSGLCWHRMATGFHPGATCRGSVACHSWAKPTASRLRGLSPEAGAESRGGQDPADREQVSGRHYRARSGAGGALYSRRALRQMRANQ